MTSSQHRALRLMLGNVACISVFVFLSHANYLVHTYPTSLSEVFTSKLTFILPSALLTVLVAKQHRSYFAGLMTCIVCTCGIISVLHGLRALLYPQPEALSLGLKMAAAGITLVIPSVAVWYATDTRRIPMDLA